MPHETPSSCARTPQPAYGVPSDHHRSGTRVAVATRRIFLHIGAMKTGTTYIQSVLGENRERLLDEGVLFPGEGWGNQVRAVEDVLRLSKRRDGRPTPTPRPWPGLVEEIRSFGGETVVVSMEWLSFARRAQVRSVVSSLGPIEVRAVLTLRDATRTAPAVWQTDVHNGSTISWPRFARGVRAAPRFPSTTARYAALGGTRMFAHSQDARYILRSWAGQLGAERVDVVTVPAEGDPPQLLWARFASAIGVPPELCRPPESPANTSLGLASTELLRLVNGHVKHLAQVDYDKTIKEHLALRVLSLRRSGEPSIGMDRTTSQAALRWNQLTRRAVTASGCRVVGDLADLPVEEGSEPASGAGQFQVEDEDLLAAAEAAVTGLQVLVRRRARRLRKRGLPTGTTAGAPPTRGRTRGHVTPVDEAVAEVVDVALRAAELGRRLREAPEPT